MSGMMIFTCSRVVALVLVVVLVLVLVALAVLVVLAVALAVVLAVFDRGDMTVLLVRVS